MIICVTCDSIIYDNNGIPTGKTNFCVSHGIDSKTQKKIIMSNDHPRTLGSVFDDDIGEWIIK